MNKKITLIIVVLVILVLAGVGYKFLGQKTSPTIPPTTVAKPTAAAENVVSGTLKSLFSGGKTETCTIIYPTKVPEQFILMVKNSAEILQLKVPPGQK